VFLAFGSSLCHAFRMSTKRTKSEKSQRKADKLEERLDDQPDENEKKEVEREESSNSCACFASARGNRCAISCFIFAVASALTFFYHGSAILFGAFGGPGPNRFASAMHAPVAICS